ncbi:LacI family DNA-binding transcriptional regulator [Psychromonas aquimarina]|uniref:LacI family DNA-binding transcriptional regulator n=1 Tax=Psychromonas aquimarina TaxID=444919 RepID=UPI000418FFB1|nr:LacI family DNA-binding transcriptional regulator [Psychromonas aquimarina]
MATMQDVSRRAGVAVSTVSRVLNGTAKISQATKDAVFQAVEELNYRPNVLAQSLSKQQTNTIGLVIPRGAAVSQYLSQLIEKCQETADQNGKFLLISQAFNQPDGAVQSIRALVDRRCDAVLYYHNSFFEQNNLSEDVLSDLIDEFQVPLVVINRQLPRHPNHSVWLDNVKNASLPVEYCLKQGHQRIAYIAAPLKQKTSQDRLLGYQQALAAYELEVDPLLISQAERSYQGGYQACRQLLQNSTDFTALCCFNDQMAIGALKALHEAGLSVPEDVSLFGLDNEDILDFFEPGISSVSQPTHEFVTHAMQLLLAHLTNSPVPDSRHNAFSGQLVLRGSVRSLNNKS